MNGIKPSSISQLNQQGITLIQVIITLALVGIMGMMLMRMTTLMQKNQASLEKNVEVDFFMKKIGSILISKDNCLETFSGYTLALDTPTDVPIIRQRDNANNVSELINITNGVGTEIGTGFRNRSDLVSITVTRIGAAEARLSFRFDRGQNTNAKRYYGARFFNKNIPVIFRLNSTTDAVEGCYGDINNSLEASCDKLGGEFDPVAGTCLIFNLVFNQHSSQQCESIGGTVVEDTEMGAPRPKFCRVPYSQFQLVKGWTQYKNWSETDPAQPAVPETPGQCLPPIAANTVPMKFQITSIPEANAAQTAINDYTAGVITYEPARGPIMYGQCTPPGFHAWSNQVIEEYPTSVPGYPECDVPFVQSRVLFIGAY